MLSKSSSVMVRPGSPRDLEVFTSLYLAYYREKASRRGWPVAAEAEYEYGARLIMYSVRDRVFLAYYDGDPAGFVRVHYDEGEYWIHDIYVRPEYRRRGVGRALVFAAEEWISERDHTIHVRVDPLDADALAFWGRLGYSLVGRLVLEKELQPASKGARILRPLDVNGHILHARGWLEPPTSEAEKRFQRALKRFVESGGTREDFLETVAEALEGWVERRTGRG